MKSVTGNDFTGCISIESFEVDSRNTKYASPDNCNAVISKGNNPTLIAGCKNTVIPSTVVAIGYFAFDSHAEITEMSIPII